MSATMMWMVTDAGEVTIEESADKTWSGTIDASLNISLQKTFSTTCHGEKRTDTATYGGTVIEQADGTYRLDMESIEDWCPPNCQFRVIYSVTKEQ